MMQFYKHEAVVLVGGKRVECPPMAVTFTIDFDRTPDLNAASIGLYNLSEETENAVKKGGTVILDAGYEGDTGTVFAGRVDELDTTWQGADRVLWLEATDRMDAWFDMEVSMSFAEGTRASKVILALLGQFGLSAGGLELPRDPAYQREVSFTGNLRSALGQVAQDCGTSFQVRGGSVYFGNATGMVSAVRLTPGTGLLGTPGRVDNEHGERYRVDMLFNYRVQAGSPLQLESRRVKGNFFVVKGRHVFGHNRAVTTVEVAQYE